MKNNTLIELIQIVRRTGSRGDIYHNTIGVFPNVAIAKAYAEARSVSSLGRTPLSWVDTSNGQRGTVWVAYEGAPNRGTASWQIIAVDLEWNDQLEDGS